MGSYSEFVQRKNYENFVRSCLENNIDLESVLSLGRLLDDSPKQGIVAEFANNVNMLGQAMANPNTANPMQNRVGTKPTTPPQTNPAMNQQKPNLQQAKPANGQLNPVQNNQQANSANVQQLTSQLQNLQAQLAKSIPELGKQMNQIIQGRMGK